MSDDVNWRGEKSQTLRPTVPAMEARLFETIPVLDHGFIRVIDYMGDDAAVVQAARVSYGKGTKKTTEDRGLIRYLMRHRHTTPFEMCDIKFHIKLPIFIARQWIRHRTASVNEYSGRYSILDREFYVPSSDNLAAQATLNKQGRDDIITGERAEHILRLLQDDATRCYNNYEWMMDDPDQPLARELARMNLTLNYYTQWYWKINLHNWMHFLSLRADNHAQHEIQVYAKAMLEILKDWLPITYEAFCDYRVGGLTLSAVALDIVKRMLAGENVTQETSGLSAREWNEIMPALGVNPK